MRGAGTTRVAWEARILRARGIDDGRQRRVLDADPPALGAVAVLAAAPT